jgi:inner membrane protein
LEPITHFLFGANLGRAGLNRKTALATATLTLAAEAPDLDVFALFGGRPFGFHHHRGFTHSFLGAFLVAAAVVAFMYGIYLLRRKKYAARYEKLPPRWGLLYLYAYMASVSHILLDFTNNYGVRPFWPFSERWYSWDIVSIVEPVLLVFLVGGLIVPALFKLIHEEIGARAEGPPGRIAARVALIGVALTWGVRDFEHRRAVAVLDSRVYKGAAPLRVSAYPYMLNPFRWYGVAETHDFIAGVNVDSLASDMDADDKMRIRYKPEETPATRAAKESYLGRVYLDWAQYPVTETETLTDPPGYVVRFVDLRYDYLGVPRRRRPLGAAVVLDSQLHVVGNLFGADTLPQTRRIRFCRVGGGDALPAPFLPLYPGGSVALVLWRARYNQAGVDSARHAGRQ